MGIECKKMSLELQTIQELLGRKQVVKTATNSYCSKETLYKYARIFKQ